MSQPYLLLLPMLVLSTQLKSCAMSQLPLLFLPQGVVLIAQIPLQLFLQSFVVLHVLFVPILSGMLKFLFDFHGSVVFSFRFRVFVLQTLLLLAANEWHLQTFSHLLSTFSRKTITNQAIAVRMVLKFNKCHLLTLTRVTNITVTYIL